MDNKTAEYLNSKFLEWQNQTRRRRTVTEFASYLDVSYTSLVGWMNGVHPPSLANVRKLSGKLGPEIYDVMGMTPPLDEVSLESLPPDLRADLDAAMRDMARALEAGMDLESDEGLKVLADMLRSKGFTIRMIK